MKIIFPDGTSYIKEHVPGGELPTPVINLPNGVHYSHDSIGRFGRVHHDDVLLGYSRTTEEDRNIQFTNEIQQLREYDIKDGEYKVFPYSKNAVNILNTIWWDWLGELMGEFVRSKFQQDEYGFMDNGPDKLYALLCGGNLVHEYDTHFQHGYWSLISTQDFNSPPDLSLTYENAPHLMTKQYLVFSTEKVTIGWTVDKGAVGGNGDVVFPRVTSKQVAMETKKIGFYPKPTFNLSIYGESLIVDGIVKNKADLAKIDVTIEELLFSGSNTYGRAGKDWYLLEEMLIRGDKNEPGLYGNWLDRRVYADPWNHPAPVAVIGWTKEKD